MAISRRLAVAGGVALLSLRSVAKAASPDRPRRIGLLAQDLQPGLLESFRAGLHDLGYVEGQNLAIEVRDAGGRSQRLPGLADDLLRLKVEVIVAVNTPAAKAAKAATASVPIIMMRVADPVRSGLIASLARTGGNVTGLSFMPDVLGPKGVELLREVLPTVSRMGSLYQGNNPGAEIIVKETDRRCAQLGISLLFLPVLDPSDYAGAFRKAVEARVEALFVMDDGTITKHRREILDLAAGHALPIVSIYRDFAVAGGLIAYGPSLPAVYRRGAYYVDRLLKGVPPTELPVEQPTKFDLFINMKTAKALGIRFPRSILARADEVIE